MTRKIGRIASFCDTRQASSLCMLIKLETHLVHYTQAGAQFIASTHAPLAITRDAHTNDLVIVQVFPRLAHDGVVSRRWLSHPLREMHVLIAAPTTQCSPG